MRVAPVATVMKNHAYSVIATGTKLRVLTIENAPQIPEYLYCLKERKGARLPAAFLGLAQEISGAEQCAS